jgi:hypothetical protein
MTFFPDGKYNDVEFLKGLAFVAIKALDVYKGEYVMPLIDFLSRYEGNSVLVPHPRRWSISLTLILS